MNWIPNDNPSEIPQGVELLCDIPQIGFKICNFWLSSGNYEGVICDYTEFVPEEIKRYIIIEG